MRAVDPGNVGRPVPSPQGAFFFLAVLFFEIRRLTCAFVMIVCSQLLCSEHSRSNVKTEPPGDNYLKTQSGRGSLLFVVGEIGGEGSPVRCLVRVGRLV